MSVANYVERLKMPDQTAEIARSLKEISHHLRTQTRILEAINHNLVEIFKKPSDTVEPAPPIEDDVEPRQVYGWSMANLVQREDRLVKGDIKIEKDDSRWVWNGEAWERVEEPSARKPD